MSQRIALFWPGDYRSKPNELARPQVEAATVQLEGALKELGRESYRVPDFVTRPHEAIERLGPITDPMIGVFTHWCYGPHTTEGVVGKENPLLLACNFSGTWPGLVALLNTGACLEAVGREFSRLWCDADNWATDEKLLARLEEWLTTGTITWPGDAISTVGALSDRAVQLAGQVEAEIRHRRILALMLGDTSMGMINGYFGPRLLHPIGFAEHKVDQAWLIDRGRNIAPERIEHAYHFVVERGVTFHHQEGTAEDFTPEATKEQLRDYLTVLDLVSEFQADCVGWQYQLGLINLRPPSDFAEGLLNSACRPESNGDPIADSTEADQGNLIPMELMKRLLKVKGLHPAVFFHDVRWGNEHDGRFLWVLLNSGAAGAYAFNHDPDSLVGVHSYRQPREYFPVPGGTFSGVSLPGEITWSRAYLREGELWMDVGQGEVVALPTKVCEAWLEATTPQWPIMTADLRLGRDSLMAHYMSNHIAVAYGDIFEELIALCQALGFRVRVLMEN